MEATQIYAQQPGYFKRLGAIDWAFALALCAGALYAFNRFGAYMDIYEKVILLASAPCFAALGWYWKPLRWLMPLSFALALAAISMYQGQLAAADTRFFLKYMLSSQSAILWMSTLFFLSTLFYWGGLFTRSTLGGALGSKLCWAAVVLGVTGMLVRWYESYLIGADIGHIPISNLYEVFILFALITAMFYLYYEEHYATRALGPFVLLVISAAVAFLLWYTVARGAAEIQPLVPALQSWWMKIHVPANFIGYGTFALASMVAWAYLLKYENARTLWLSLVVAPIGIVAACWLIAFIGGAQESTTAALAKTTQMVGGLVVLFAITNLVRGKFIDRLPGGEVLEDVMYKAISIGFAFFTIATILGALWAAEAWGGYWSWDPKETWALIVWLNYAAWLHMRLMSGLRGKAAAWWAVVGLLVTTFAFLGVNMFLSGLHSYGKL
ncbi:c-type cytochrome biogenesis protein CcsB [Pseudoduganella sp. DS3]|uniref:C-type cytochrome biogenesis protein CcsB n=1 Tax=Pseudoduganella guangdongensis TaxID=2692179 RepID=A0A6N9HJ55_9BURK|nr:c-type cytochrome biogenesis protein CcsB [Pseudoduganella guangdongensis]MYN02825.1 c-type cytochrome biogenesis protein CcsB [Pseudoduganella guangdongensis]